MVVKDDYQGGQLVSESDGNGALLAAFTYDATGVPSSVQVGSDLTTAPRYAYSCDVVDVMGVRQRHRDR